MNDDPNQPKQASPEESAEQNGQLNPVPPAANPVPSQPQPAPAPAYGVNVPKPGKPLWLKVVLVIAGIIAGLFLLMIAISSLTYESLNDSVIDVERKSEVSIIQSGLETYYFEAGTYPSAAQLTDEAWRQAHLPSIDADVFVAPPDNTPLNGGVYSYEVTPAACEGTAQNPCEAYTLQAALLSEEEVPYVVRSEARN